MWALSGRQHSKLVILSVPRGLRRSQWREQFLTGHGSHRCKAPVLEKLIICNLIHTERI